MILPGRVGAENRRIEPLLWQPIRDMVEKATDWSKDDDRPGVTAGRGGKS
jgi:hypothetical protein